MASWRDATLPVSTMIVAKRSNQRKVFTFVSCSVPSPRVERQQGNGDSEDLPFSTSITAWRAEGAMVHFEMEIIFSHGGEHVPQCSHPTSASLRGGSEKDPPNGSHVRFTHGIAHLGAGGGMWNGDGGMCSVAHQQLRGGLGE